MDMECAACGYIRRTEFYLDDDNKRRSMEYGEDFVIVGETKYGKRFFTLYACPDCGTVKAIEDGTEIKET